MKAFKENIGQGVVFDNKIDPLTMEIIEGKPTMISWKTTYDDLNRICDRADPFEFGVHYHLGIRTIMDNVVESWISRGTKNQSDYFDNIEATIGWNEKGHAKLQKYLPTFISVLGQPDEEMNNLEGYKDVLKTWGPYNCWKFGDIKISLWGSDFRGSMWYKIDIEKKKV